MLWVNKIDSAHCFYGALTEKPLDRRSEKASLDSRSEGAFLEQESERFLCAAAAHAVTFFAIALTEKALDPV